MRFNQLEPQIQNFLFSKTTVPNWEIHKHGKMMANLQQKLKQKTVPVMLDTIDLLTSYLSHHI